MIHIVFLVPTLDHIGGAESQVLLLATGLAKRGQKITLIALSGDALSRSESCGQDPCRDWRERLKQAGVTFFSLGMRKAWIDPRGWLRYWVWARNNGVNVVHAHLLHAVWFGRFVRLLIPVPVVLETIHTTRAMSGMGRTLTRLSNRLSNGTTCVSEAVAQSVRSSRAIPAYRLTVLPNGIELNPNWISMMERRDERWRETRSFHWVALGRLSAVKDYPTMLRAFATIVGHAESTHEKPPTLTIAGEGPEEDVLRRLAQDLQIAHHVRFVGFQHDVQPLLGAADAFVLSSLWEGLPIGVLEAQAASLPVVATDGPGTRHALIDGITGFLVPVGDVSLLVHAMMRVMAMPSCQRSHMGSRGHDFVAQSYSIKTVLDRLELLYRGLLAEQPRASRLAHRRISGKVFGKLSRSSSSSLSVHGGNGREADIP